MIVNKRLAITAVLLIILITSPLLLSAKLVKATSPNLLNVNWGHQQRPADPDEQYIENSICSDITVMFNSQSNWFSNNAYGYYSTQANLLGAIAYRQTYGSWATDFWAGDFFILPEQGFHWEEQWDGYDYYFVKVYDDIYIDHYCFYGDARSPPQGWHGGYDDVRDDAIASYTLGTTSAQHFSFIWTCSCANIISDPNNNPVYGYVDYDHNTGVVGMPLAWTGRSDLSWDAYDFPDYSNYCYLGFNGGSMPLKQQVENTSWIYASFVWYFYYYLVYSGVHHTIQASLDYAAEQVFGTTFWYCPLWQGYDVYNPVFGWLRGWMNIYGNSLITMPYS